MLELEKNEIAKKYLNLLSKTWEYFIAREGGFSKNSWDFLVWTCAMILGMLVFGVKF